MSDPSFVARCLPYLPRIVIEQIAQTGKGNHLFQRNLPVAVLFADVSGFTALTERMTGAGAGGTERLTEVLNHYFDLLIHEVHRFGGDVLKFAGDALLAVWPASSMGADLALACWRALECAQAIQDRLGHDGGNTAGAAATASAAAESLRMRIAIGAGDVTMAHLGGVFDRWEFIVAGTPLDQVGHCSADIEPGHIGIAGGALDLLRRSSPLHLEVETRGATAILRGRVPEAPPRRSWGQESATAEDAEHLAAYLPNAVLYKLRAGQDLYVGEMRRVSVLFLNLPDLGHDTPLESANEVMRALQNACYRYEGSINKLSVDDKGISLLAAFGLPPFGHEDDPIRAVRAAQDAHAALQSKGFRSSVGICTGRAYCGVIGSTLRREYTLMGDPVNLAARLMQKAGGRILCDAATHRRARRALAFDNGAPMDVKGRRRPVWAYHPIGPSGTMTGTVENRIVELVGREPEQARVRQMIDTLIWEGRVRPLAFLGEPGIGKSALAQWSIQAARRNGLRALFAAGEAIERNTAYHLWQRLLTAWLGLRELDKREVRDRIAAALARSGLADQAALLNPLLRTHFPVGNASAGLTGEDRAARIRELVLTLIRDHGAGPTLVVIDDYQDADSASRTLLAWIIEQQPQVALLVTARTTGALDRDLGQVGAVDFAERHILAPLSADAIRTLVMRELDVDRLPAVLSDHVARQAEGVPLFARELVQVLAETGRLQMRGRVCLMSPLAVRDSALPDSIESIVTSRIDALPIELQLVLKLAAVIGREFERDEIAAIGDGASADRIKLQIALNQLCDHGLLARIDEQPGRLRFRHSVTQQVAYRLMLNTQRGALHRRYAAWLEQRADTALRAPAVLAWHWEQGGDDERAFNWVERAAEVALLEDGNDEAAGILDRALRRPAAATLLPLTRARWWRMLSEAQRNLGLLRAARDSATQGLAELGIDSPRRPLAKWAGIALEAVRMQMPRRRLSPAQSALAVEAALICETTSVVHYQLGDPQSTALATLRAVNFARRSAPDSPVWLRAQANLTLITGSMGMHRLAQRFCDSATAAAERIDDLPSRAWAMLPMAIFEMSIARWDRAVTLFNRGREAALKLSNTQRACEYEATALQMLTLQGAWEHAARRYRELHATGARLHNEQVLSWGALGYGRLLVRQGRINEFDAWLPTIREVVDSETQADGPRGDLFDLYGQCALAELGRGDEDAAQRQVWLALGTLERPTQVAFILPGEQVALAAHRLWAAQPGDARRKEMAATSRRLLRDYVRFAPLGRTSLTYFNAVADGIDGQREPALKGLAAAWRDARDRQLPLVRLLSAATARHWYPDTVDPWTPDEVAALDQLRHGLGMVGPIPAVF